MVQVVEFSASLQGISPMGPAVVVVGNFDGVHDGHKALLDIGCNLAENADLPLAVLTFEPHPRQVLFPDKPFKRLTDKMHKVELLAAEGVDTVAILAFDRTVAEWSPQHFMDEILVKALQAQIVVVGENFRFGHKAAGDLDTLLDHEGFDVVGVALVEDEGGVVSSSRLREGLKD